MSGSGVRVGCPSPGRGPGWQFGSGKVRSGKVRSGKVSFYFLSEKCTFLTRVGKNVPFVLLSEKLQSEKRLSIIWSSEKLLSEKSRGAVARGV